jgi:hypothetical protein
LSSARAGVDDRLFNLIICFTCYSINLLSSVDLIHHMSLFYAHVSPGESDNMISSGKLLWSQTNWFTRSIGKNTMAIRSSPDKRKDTSLTEGTCIESWIVFSLHDLVSRESTKRAQRAYMLWLHDSIWLSLICLMLII